MDPLGELAALQPLNDMCTLAVMLNAAGRHPLIVAANRDEDRTRPATPPVVWAGATAFVAGRDQRAGGTWMGINQHGVFVGLTNLWTGQPPDESRASRGAVVVDLLRAGSLVQARATLQRVGKDATNPFLVVCADKVGRGFWASTAQALHPHELDPGLLVLGNLPPGDARDQKLQRAADLLREPPLDGGDEEQLLSRLQAALRAHHGDRGPHESLCVHSAGNYGTVSSTLLLASARLGEGRLLHASGPPCVTPYQDRSGLLVHLGRRAALAHQLAAMAMGPLDPREERHRQRMLELLAQADDPFSREHYLPGHFTASGFVLSPDRARLLLIHHAKLDRWLQPGGHIEPADRSALDAARREVIEETAVDLEANPAGTAIFDVDVHVIPARGEVPAHEHFDVRFLLHAADQQLRSGADVHAARWVPLDDVERALTDESVRRVVRKLRATAG